MPACGTIRADYNGNTHIAESKDKLRAAIIKAYLIRVSHVLNEFGVYFVVRNTKADLGMVLMHAR